MIGKIDAPPGKVKPFKKDKGLIIHYSTFSFYLFFYFNSSVVSIETNMEKVLPTKNFVLHN